MEPDDAWPAAQNASISSTSQDLLVYLRRCAIVSLKPNENTPALKDSTLDTMKTILLRRVPTCLRITPQYSGETFEPCSGIALQSSKASTSVCSVSRIVFLDGREVISSPQPRAIRSPSADGHSGFMLSQCPPRMTRSHVRSNCRHHRVFPWPRQTKATRQMQI